MKDDKSKNIGKGLLSLGIGSIATYYFLEVSRIQLLPLAMKIQEMIIAGEMPDMKVQIYEIAILLIGTVTLLAAPLFIQWNKNAGYKIFMILFLVFADMGAVVTVIARGEIFPMYIVLLWGTAVFLVWLCVDIFKIIDIWLKTEEGKYDLVKMTFVWTIVAFLIGKMW